MIEMRDILERLLQRRDLTEAESGELLVALTDSSVAPAMSGALLAALRSKGITPAEVRGFAGAMRGLARRPNLPPGPPASTSSARGRRVGQLQSLDRRVVAGRRDGCAGRKARQSLSLEPFRERRPSGGPRSAAAAR